MTTSVLQTITTGGAEELVILPHATYNRLIVDLEEAQDIAGAKAFEARETAGGADWLPWELARRI